MTADGNVQKNNQSEYARELEASGFGNLLKIAEVSDGKKVRIKKIEN